MMITIENLTPHQVKLLDTMWSINSEEDLIKWKSQLSKADQLMVNTLIQMIVLAYIDEDVNNDSEFEIANDVLNQFK